MRLRYSPSVPPNTPISIGLGGDGDEVAAISEVERAFGVKLDYSDARRWLTAGDVFDALRNALSDDERERADLWERFATAICGITGVDPQAVERGSPLLSKSRFWAHVADASAALWAVIVLAFIAVIATVALSAS